MMYVEGKIKGVPRGSKLLNCYQLPDQSLGGFLAVSTGQEVPIKCLRYEYKRNEGNLKDEQWRIS